MSGKFASTVGPALLSFIFAAIKFDEMALTPLHLSTITATQTWIPGLCAVIALVIVMTHAAKNYKKEMADAGVLPVAEAAQQ